ncbi:MAG: S8 family serine peptidase [Corynebacteriales bacterium]|nr:S8 family serine peptidase [Mycobacteriales bacterium]
MAPFTVVAEKGASAESVKAAITQSGGTITSANEAAGVFQVQGPTSDFASKVTATDAIIGATSERAIGYAPQANGRSTEANKKIESEHLGAEAKKPSKPGQPAEGMDPLDDKLWGLDMIQADEARKINGGDKRVTVGVMDTGLDASHPDLARNFNAEKSRNFAPDIESIDGPCEVAGCLDPVGTDDGGHGTHVAGTIAAAANGYGLSGVAPNVSLVELKTGQDSGYFFLKPVVDALVYAGDNGLDVVNMSFYVDPWLYNCQANPADSPEQQAEQRAIVEAVNRSLEYAHNKGVTLVGALGNEHTDLGKPGTDASSPDYPADSAYERTIDNSTCLSMPAEGSHVIGVSALGPSGKKSDFSNYGTEQISVSAPGGYFRDGFGTDSFQKVDNLILSTYPRKVLEEEGLVDADGNLTEAGTKAGVIKECTADGKCGYYNWLQGTSMASPHAAGVSALVVSAHGHKDKDGGLTMKPNKVERILLDTATATACPEPRTVSYTNEGRPAEFDATCEGDKNFNGFYGYGIVNALGAVQR